MRERMEHKKKLEIPPTQRHHTIDMESPSTNTVTQAHRSARCNTLFFMFDSFTCSKSARNALIHSKHTISHSHRDAGTGMFHMHTKRFIYISISFMLCMFSSCRSFSPSSSSPETENSSCTGNLVLMQWP